MDWRRGETSSIGKLETWTDIETLGEDKEESNDVINGRWVHVGRDIVEEAKNDNPSFVGNVCSSNITCWEIKILVEKGCKHM